MSQDVPRYETTAQRLGRKIDAALKLRAELQTRLDRADGAIAVLRMELADHQKMQTVFAENARERRQAMEKVYPQSAREMDEEASEVLLTDEGKKKLAALQGELDAIVEENSSCEK